MNELEVPETIRDAIALLPPDKTLYLVSEDDSSVSISPAFICICLPLKQFCFSWDDPQFPPAYLKDVAHRRK